MEHKRNKIKDYLQSKNRDYFEGIALLSSVCNKRVLISHLSRKQSVPNFNKLIYELTKSIHVINETTENPPKNTGESAEIRPPRVNPSPGYESDKPSIKKSTNKGLHSIFRTTDNPGDSNRLLACQLDLSPLEDQKKMLYAERDHLHPQLMLVDSDEKRFELAKRISDISPKISKLNHVINEIKSTGQIPMKYAVELLPAKQYKRLENVKVNIRRLKREIKNPKSIASKTQNEKRLAQYEAEQKSILRYE